MTSRPHRGPAQRRPHRAGAAAAGRRPVARHVGRRALGRLRRRPGRPLPRRRLGPARARRQRAGRGPFTIADLAAAVLDLVDEVQASAASRRRRSSTPATRSAERSGCSCCSTRPDRVAGRRDPLHRRARSATPRRGASAPRLVRARGHAGRWSPAPLQRWFAAGFLEREPERASALLHSLRTPTTRATRRSARRSPRSTSATGSARSRSRCSRSPARADVATPPALLRGDRRRRRRTAGSSSSTDVAHLPPAEAPAGRPPDPRAPAHGDADRRAARRDDRGGLRRRDGRPPRGARRRPRRPGDAPARPTSPRDFQELITSYAWGSIWTRPGLDRRSRSMITLTALVARGHHEELAMHVRAARTNGLTDDEIKEVHPADRDLLRRPRRQHRVPHRPAACSTDPANRGAA